MDAAERRRFFLFGCGHLEAMAAFWIVGHRVVRGDRDAVQRIVLDNAGPGGTLYAEGTAADVRGIPWQRYEVIHERAKVDHDVGSCDEPFRRRCGRTRKGPA